MSDPYSKLEAVLVLSARQRDERLRKERDEALAKTARREAATAIWSARKLALPDIVRVIDGMLKSHGFPGVTLAPADQKHNDIGQAVIEFEQSPRNRVRIQLIASADGEFVCSVSAITGYAPLVKIAIGDLTEDRLKEVLSEAVKACLDSNLSPLIK